MNFRRFFSAILFLSVCAAAHAGTMIIPAAGTGPGAYGSQWRTQVNLHNASKHSVAEIRIYLHRETTVHPPVSLSLSPRETRSLENILDDYFDVTSGGGALRIVTDEPVSHSVVVTSRTYNASTEGGNYGQDIPAYDQSEALGTNDIGALLGPSLSAGNRFNFGLYCHQAATVSWELVRFNGQVAATREVSYATGQHVQYNLGIETFFNSTPGNNDTIYARVKSGQAIAFGSIINETGDPTYVPGTRTRDGVAIIFKGVDLDEDGDLEILDANEDGVLDRAIEIKTSLFPSHFRVEASGDMGEPVIFSVLTSPTSAVFTDPSGLMRVVALSDVVNKIGEIVIRAESGTASATFRIPVQFK